MIFKITFNLIILTLIIFYKNIFPSSFFINIILFIYIFGTIYYLIKPKINKKLITLIKSLVFLGIFIFMTSLTTILVDIYRHKTIESKNEYVIVLGAALNGRKPKKVLKYRLDKAIEYHKEYPNTIFIVSGGKGKDEVISESEAMKNYLLSYGVPQNKIIEENQSKTTLENLIFSRKLIPAKVKNIGVISNDFHMYRVKFFAKSLNFKINTIYTKTPFKSKVSLFARESLAIIYYYLKDLKNIIYN